MAFEPDDAFLRRLIARNHFLSKPVGQQWRLSTGVFKFTSQRAENGWYRCSVDYECPANTLGQVLARHRQTSPDCGLARIRHRQVSTVGASVTLRPEGGNEHHCDLEFPDDQEIIRKLTDACEVVAIPPSLQQ
jgi:hypothetical protein